MTGQKSVDKVSLLVFSDDISITPLTLACSVVKR